MAPFGSTLNPSNAEVGRTKRDRPQSSLITTSSGSSSPHVKVEEDKKAIIAAREVRFECRLASGPSCLKTSKAQGSLRRSQTESIFFICDMFRPEIDVRQPQCEYEDCFRTARYGPREGPMSFCQDHKRAGMYTSRNGKWLVATNDGNAFRSTGLRDEVGGQDNSYPASIHSSREGSHLANKRSGRQEQPHGRRGKTVSKGSAKARSAGDPKAEKAEATDSRARGPTQTLDTPCNAPGCRKPAAYGVKRGLGKEIFCGDHKAADMVEMSNRPCIYPGCYVKARYGLEGARPVYCADHKKGPMMRLLLVTQEDVAGGSPSAKTKDGDVGTETIAPAVDLPKPCDAMESAPGNRGLKEKQELECDLEQSGSTPERDGKTKGGAKLKRKVKQASSADTAMSSQDSSKPTHLPQQGERVAAMATATLEPESRSLPCLPDSADGTQGVGPSAICPTGGAPSAEMRLLQQAREVARVAAQASGSGRRARAPSLKALRAAGLLDEEGTQVLTKAMNDEEVQKSKARREQWRAGVAVGLRVGHVLEALTPKDPPEGNFSGTVAGLDGQGKWRRLTAEEILGHGTGRFFGSTHQHRGLGVGDSNGKTESGSGNAAGSVVELSKAPESTVVVPSKRKSSGIDGGMDGVEVVAGSGVASEGLIGPDLNGVKGTEEPQHGKEQVIEANGTSSKQGLSRHGKVRRQPEYCRKKPRYGIDGVARCCKKHEGLLK